VAVPLERQTRAPRAVLLTVLRGFVAPLRQLISLDRWQEIFDTLRHNKLRTALTALSVAWGIFILVLLLGLGNGLDTGTRHKFQVVNNISIHGGKLSTAHAGFQIGRRVQFDNKDFDQLATVDGIDRRSAKFDAHGGFFSGGNVMIRRGTKANSFDMESVHPDQLYIDAIKISFGRFVDQTDVDKHRKVVVIGEPVRDFLFGTDDPIGHWIDLAGIPFQVVGVFSHEGSQEEERLVYVPISTAQATFNGANHVSRLEFTVGDATPAESEAIANQVVAHLAERHQFSPDDKMAVHVHNNVEEFERFARIFRLMSLFVLFVAGGTIAAGVIGVSNIMMIAVKERTKEIGVRKAMGATAWSIVALITQEAIFLTAIAGFLGLVAGIGALELADRMLPPDGFVLHPAISLVTGIWATIALMAAGALAGYFPARSAAKVNPIEALRDQ
jgi:putative ABC transport system permease protein